MEARWFWVMKSVPVNSFHPHENIGIFLYSAHLSFVAAHLLDGLAPEEGFLSGGEKS